MGQVVVAGLLPHMLHIPIIVIAGSKATTPEINSSQ
jgi:hypothetical protein